MKNIKSKPIKMICSNFFMGLLIVGMLFVWNITNHEYNLFWWLDVNVWLDDFFSNVLLFCISYSLLSKITNELISFLISYALSIIVGNFIVLSVSNNITFWKIAFGLGISILWFVLSHFKGFFKGRRFAKEQNKLLIEDINEMESINKDIIANLNEEQKTQLYNLKRFYNKHPKECEMIEQIGIDTLLNIIEIDQYIKKERNQQ